MEHGPVEMYSLLKMTFSIAMLVYWRVETHFWMVFVPQVWPPPRIPVAYEGSYIIGPPNPNGLMQVTVSHWGKKPKVFTRKDGEISSRPSIFDTQKDW